MRTHAAVLAAGLAAALASGLAPAAATAEPARPTRLAITLDTHRLVIATASVQPALLDDARWSHQLAILATDGSARGALLHVAIVPRGAAVSAADVVRDAVFTQAISAGRPLAITPGRRGIARDLFGAAPPRRVTVALAAR